MDYYITLTLPLVSEDLKKYIHTLERSLPTAIIVILIYSCYLFLVFIRVIISTR